MDTTLGLHWIAMVLQPQLRNHAMKKQSCHRCFKTITSLTIAMGIVISFPVCTARHAHDNETLIVREHVETPLNESKSGKMKGPDLNRGSKPAMNITKLSQAFEAVMLNYDKKFRPFYGGKPVEVALDFHVLSFGKIQEVEMEYGIDFYFAQFWKDPRFNISHECGNGSIELPGAEVSKIWLPDTIFINSKSSKFHHVTVENRFLTIDFNGGNIIYHARITMSGSCRMDLRHYPFDKQICYLAIESYGHDDADLVYKWKEDKTCKKDCNQVLIYDRDLSNFDILEAVKLVEKTTYHTDRFSWATAKFVFQRRTQFFLLQVYLPCVLIVMVSWSSFWIAEDAVPARAAISVTTILTIITMLGVVNANMPRVSYVKALDFYLFMSFIFVFLSLVEYIFVLNCRGFFKFKRKLERRRGKSDRNQGKNIFVMIGLDEGLYVCEETGKRKVRSSIYQNGYSNSNARRRTYCQSESFVDTEIGECDSVMPLNGRWYGEYGRRRASTIDIASRLLFPVGYCLFNVGYWALYLHDSLSNDI